ncbi:MAG: hypothetical protein IKT42_00915 [Clostridia bacterium]|nr:hypothetical protein [Clostridia bacterium]
MENIITNNTYINNENTTAGNTTEKEIHNGPSAWEKFKRRVNQFLNAIYIIRCVCCFTSIFSVLGTLVLIFGGSMTLGGILFVIGLPSALLACPIKFLSIVLAFTTTGFTIGLCFVGFGCVIGAAIGFILAVVLWLYFPAFVTIPHYFKELRR